MVNLPEMLRRDCCETRRRLVRRCLRVESKSHRVTALRKYKKSIQRRQKLPKIIPRDKHIMRRVGKRMFRKSRPLSTDTCTRNSPKQIKLKDLGQERIYHNLYSRCASATLCCRLLITLVVRAKGAKFHHWQSNSLMLPLQNRLSNWSPGLRNTAVLFQGMSKATK
jgi:hypothetical protein